MSEPIVAFSFPAPAERLTMNHRYHWAKQRTIARAWRTRTMVEARNWALTPDNPVSLPLPPCAVKVTFGVPDNRRRDPHNTAPTVKAIIDGMVDAGLWRDDTPDQVAVLDPAFVKGTALVTVECWPL